MSLKRFASLCLLCFSFMTCLLPFHVAAGEEPRADRVLDTEEAPSGGDFTLKSASGPVSLQDFRGKAVLLYFGYASCPDICPTSLVYMTRSINALSEDELQKVHAIFISVDPQRDTVEELDEYVKFFHQNMTGVTGTEEEIAEVAKLYGAKYYQVEMPGGGDYAVNHSAATYLISPDGELRFLFPNKTPSTVVTEAIRYLMDGK